MTVGENVAYGLGSARSPRLTGGPGHRGARMVRLDRLRGAPAEPALRRPAPAGRARAGARQPAQGPPARRAARRARPEAPRGDADRAQAIQREVGITFIFVTHDQEEALTMSDRIAVFNRGRIEQVGAPPRSTSTGDARSSPASSARRTCSTASRPCGRRDRRHLHDPAREDPSGRARRRSRRRRGRGRRPDPRRRLPRRGTRYFVDSTRGAPRRPPEPRHVVDGGARTGRHTLSA